MDLEFSGEELTFQAEVRALLKKELPRAWAGGDWYDEEAERSKPGVQSLGQKMRRRLAEKSWLTLAWPQEYGGMGASHMKQLIFNEEMAYQGAPGGGGAGVAMLGPTLMLYGSEEQKREHLPRIARAEVDWCQGYSEPGSGSDLASLQTRAVEDGDDYLVNGAKIWTSGAHRADWIFFLARTDPQAPKHRGISFLLANMKSPGITVHPIRNMAGIQGFNEVVLENVRVPRRNLVGEVNRGWYYGATLLDFERSGVQRPARARRVLKDLVALAKERRPNGSALAQDPIYRNRLGAVAAEIEACRHMCYNVAWMQSQGQVPNKEASIVKVFSTEMIQHLYGLAMQMLGLYGLLLPGSSWTPSRGSIARNWLSAFSATIAAGTSEIQRNIIATRGLGLPRG